MKRQTPMAEMEGFKMMLLFWRTVCRSLKKDLKIELCQKG